MSSDSKNPFLNNKIFSSTTLSNKEEVHQATIIDYSNEMSLSGTINKSFI